MVRLVAGQEVVGVRAMQSKLGGERRQGWAGMVMEPKCVTRLYTETNGNVVRQV